MSLSTTTKMSYYIYINYYIYMNRVRKKFMLNFELKDKWGDIS